MGGAEGREALIPFESIVNTTSYSLLFVSKV